MSDPRTWIFQGNPDTFDIAAYLARDLDRISWTVSQHRQEIRPGDRVFLWRAAGRRTKAVSGIIAKCTVLSEPWQGRDEPESHNLVGIGTLAGLTGFGLELGGKGPAGARPAQRRSPLRCRAM